MALSLQVSGAIVPGSRWLPGPLLGGAIVVEVPTILVLMGLPVSNHMERGARGQRGLGRLGDLQFLEVAVDG